MNFADKIRLSQPEPAQKHLAFLDRTCYAKFFLNSRGP